MRRNMKLNNYIYIYVYIYIYIYIYTKKNFRGKRKSILSYFIYCALKSNQIWHEQRINHLATQDNDKNVGKYHRIAQ